MKQDPLQEISDILTITRRVQYDVVQLKCPKAFAELKKSYDDEEYSAYLLPGYNGCLCYWESKIGGCLSQTKWFERNLYDFFDEHWFAPCIIPVEGAFTYTYNEMGKSNGSINRFTTRSEAEAHCFTTLFYKLEEILTQAAK